MKKQLIGLMLIMSSFAFAGGDKTFDLLEDQIELKHLISLMVHTN